MTDTQTISGPARPEGSPEAEAAGADTPARRRLNPRLLGGLALLLLAVGLGWYLYSRGYESTDDAQVDGHLNPVTARVSGTIVAVHVEDNQQVEAGQPLVDLDPRDFHVAVSQSQAQYDQAVAQLGAAHPNLPITRINSRSDVVSARAQVVSAEAALAAARHDLDTALARLRQSQAENERSQADYRRYETLYGKQEVSRAAYDQYRAAAEAQAQTVAANQASVASAQKAVEQRVAVLAEQQTRLEQSESSAPLAVAIRKADIEGQQAGSAAAAAALEQARLNLGYAHIVAQIPGVVTQRSAEIGAHVSAGQQLLMIVQVRDLWVTANFKETQLARMRPGQRVRIAVDALGEDFSGTVESMPAITGSRASVLPPENATGNYVKVIQRMPVRIRFEPGQRDLDKLRPGMSVEPRVSLD